MTNSRLFSVITDTAQTRLALLAAVAWFAILFNIERINLIPGYSLNISNITYFLVIGVGVTLLSFPNLGALKLAPIALCIWAVYLAATTVFGKWARYEGRLSVIAIELIILIMSYGILRVVNRQILNAEYGLQVFVLEQESSPVVSPDTGRMLVQDELDRALRFDRSIACIFCEVYRQEDSYAQLNKLDNHIADYMLSTISHHYQRIKLVRSLSAMIYKSDIVIPYRQGYVVFLPETSKEDIDKFSYEMALMVETDEQLSLLVGEAYFPQDGSSIDELIAEARAKVHIYVKDENLESKNRDGDVYIAVEKRIEIEKQAQWIDNLTYQSPSTRMIYRPIKRLIDITATIAVVPVLIPVMLMVALVIYLDDGFPALYTQQRTGYGGRRFEMFKFRTMIVNAGTLPPKVIRTTNGEERYVWPDKDDDDPRITRVGRILRKTSLDEIPQLWNVLNGDMSLVGPRPTSWNVDKYTLLQTERLNVRPGITGLWQVSARESKDFDERLIWDVKYVEKMSLWLDVQIILRTVMQVFKRKGA